MNEMSMDNLISEASKLGREYKVLEGAVTILDALRDHGAVDVESALDILYDYDSVVKERNTLHMKYEVVVKPTRKGEAYYCPQCNRRVQTRYTYCHWCGKKIGGK